jgi:hypothetical protein
MRAFLNGIDKKDEKILISALKGSEFEPGERVIKKGAMDRCILVVAEGSLLSFTE